ncbi:hypothetical protein HPP92_018711 [Vanilla planifolia]|uniref:Homeobox-leucine zipper protein n=1 Tax=Vanilla planifolia TaxID=51239 RepID=A0A835QIL9_VANPL|nr:hypothetical protein HPP92_019301 [Vanilla planifolia]KAG0469383.1 hypothetical protein HPP92_018711 [Vanilla planifolia]
MKRPRFSDPVTGGQELYGERLPAIPDTVEENEEDEHFLGVSGCASEKKRRLSAEQVKTLEKNFEAENKLDPERKARIAYDLGLQPRQVAVWFQNRRARWKTKQLERDYAALRSSFDALVANCDSLRRDKEGLLAEIEEMKTKLGVTEDEETESKAAVSDDQPPTVAAAATATSKDGSSDSDSSAVLCDENNSPCQCGINILPEIYRRPEEIQSLMSGGGFELHHILDWRGQRNLIPKEEQSFLGEEEHYGAFFSDEQNTSFWCLS